LRGGTERRSALPLGAGGSTGIAAQLDAEEWRDLVNAYLDNASAAVKWAAMWLRSSAMG